ncbi:MAG: ABC transporter ATP-binding protein, partial [Elusimicrobia bacterium]|nr:ABC transporter ATP-binding protein [Elusimicrobiota bacterium]
MRKILPVVSVSLFLLILLVFPLLVQGTSFSYLLRLCGIVGLYVILALGLNVTLGFVGLFDLGYMAFYAIGAYT